MGQVLIVDLGLAFVLRFELESVRGPFLELADVRGDQAECAVIDEQIGAGAGAVFLTPAFSGAEEGRRLPTS